MKTELGKTISKFFFIPQRVVLGIMGFWVITVAYTIRQSLSFAITEMVAKHESEVAKSVCNDDSANSTGPIENGEELFDWSEEFQGLVLSSFYWGYILTHVPGGIIASRYGGKRVLMAGISLSILAVLISPVCVEANRDIGGEILLVLRIIIGIGQGIMFPACNVLLSSWTPPTERSIMVTLVFAGAQIGSILGSIISGALLDVYRWPSVFYFFGGAGIIWLILFGLLCYDNPEHHPFISDKEQAYLAEELKHLKRKKDLPPTPWKAILTSAPVWALIAAQIGHNWGFFIMVSDLPKYMSDVLKFSIKENGLYSALPYAVMFIVALCTGFFSDWIIAKKYLSTTKVRKLFTIVSAMGPAAFLVWASYAGCEKITVVVLFTVGMGLMGTFYSGHKANNLDLSPNYAGILMALSNGMGAISGMIGPYIVGVITTNRAMSEWQTVFWVAFAVFGVTTIMFLIWGSGEVQPWNNPIDSKLVENGNGKEKGPEDKLGQKIDFSAAAAPDNKDKY